LVLVVVVTAAAADDCYETNVEEGIGSFSWGFGGVKAILLENCQSGCHDWSCLIWEGAMGELMIELLQIAPLETLGGSDLLSSTAEPHGRLVWQT